MNSANRMLFSSSERARLNDALDERAKLPPDARMQFPVPEIAKRNCRAGFMWATQTLFQDKPIVMLVLSVLVVVQLLRGAIWLLQR